MAVQGVSMSADTNTHQQKRKHLKTIGSLLNTIRNLQNTIRTQSENNQKPSEKKQQGFQEASENIFPPDNHMKKMMEVMNKLCMKVETMERKLEELIM